MKITKMTFIISVIIVSTYSQPIHKAVIGYYYDSNADGTMDSVSVFFDNVITQTELNTMNFVFVWLKDTTGFDTLWINAQGKNFNVLDSISAGWRISGYSLKKGVTYLGDTWGQSFLIQRNISDVRRIRSNIEMVDAMPPVINSANYNAFNS